MVERRSHDICRLRLLLARTISPELGADYAYQFFGIKGAEAYNSCDPTKDGLRKRARRGRIKAVGKYKLVITLTSPQPWFIQQLSHTSFLPVYQPIVTKFGNKFTEAANFIGNGPFKLASWKHDASLTLVKNTKWRSRSFREAGPVQMQIITDGATAENAFDATTSTSTRPARSRRTFPSTRRWPAAPARARCRAPLVKRCRSIRLSARTTTGSTSRTSPT